MREHWTLDPDIDFLNHGSYGACPRAVQEASRGFQLALEREPVRFFEQLVESRLDAARAVVAPFVGANPEDLAFVANSTAGVNAVLGSLAFQPGDALLTTDHTYGACKNALDFVAERSGARTLVAEIPLPLRDPGEVVERIASAITPRVKLALIDHVTSQSGLVFPIEAIVRVLRERGIETLVDGAHAPGMLALDVERIGAGYYVGNFHKWVCAPKGAAMLWVRRDLQPGIHPPVISHGLRSTRARSRFLEEFDWTGTDDPSAWLSVPTAIRFIAGLLPGGWPEVQARNRALALQARRILQDALGVGPLAPESMLGSLAAVQLPDGECERLHARLYEKHRVQVPIFPWPRPPERLVRVSAHLYNGVDQYARLAGALKAELHDGA
jgi:isopenicillin-N epimerase